MTNVDRGISEEYLIPITYQCSTADNTYKLNVSNRRKSTEYFLDRFV